MFDAYAVLFSILETVITGGIVPGIGGTTSKIKKGFAFATLTTITPAISEIKSAKISASANAVLFMLFFPPIPAPIISFLMDLKRIFVKKP